MYPTPTDPLIMTISGKPESLKNDKKPFVDDEGNLRIMKSAKVRRYLAYAATHFAQAREKQGFDIIPMPEKVGLYVRLHLYVPPKSKIGLPTADDDNLYTTLQEALQGTICDDDRQVRDHEPVYLPARSRETEHVILYAWHIADDPEDAKWDFLNWYRTSEKNPFRRTRQTA